MLYVSIIDKIAKPKIFPTFFKKMNDVMIFCTKNKLLTPKTVLKVSLFWIFLLVQTSAKLRNSQIFENCQLWWSLNYSNFFQVFAHIFEKSEEHISRRIFAKFMDPVTSTRWEKNVFAKFFCFFLKWKYFSDITIE